MTQDPNLSAGLSNDRVAELEKKLADAAAEVAKVQAELTQATGGAPTTGMAGAQVPPVPYGGSNDLSAYLTPEVTQQIQNSLHQLGLDGALGGQAVAPEHVATLAEPPRHVPMSYRLATFDLSVYELFILLMGFIAPIAVWIFAPIVFPAALIVAVLLIAWFRGRRYVRRIGMLKWGKAATVTNNDTLDKGTYYSGVTYNNMRKRTATGWDARTIWYSGPAYKNKVDYTLDGATGSLEWRGLQYHRGVILADSRKPSRAMEVSMFPYSVKPGPDGQLTGEVSAWLWGGIIATIVIEATVVFVAVTSVLGTYVH